VYPATLNDVKDEKEFVNESATGEITLSLWEKALLTPTRSTAIID